MAYTIRRARPSEYALLPEIERAAGRAFRDRRLAPAPRPASPVSARIHRGDRASGAVFVAADDDDVPVGFALTGFLDRALHIHELDVAPPHGRRGLGRRLVDAACAFAAAEGAPAVTLSTFRDIPWNGPFYAKAGFREVPRNRWTPAFHLLHHREVGTRPSRRTALLHAEGAGVKKTLTHLDKTGAASMVDVGAKAVTERVAVAEGAVTMQPATLDLILSGNAKKGDVVGAARIAGIMAAKRTHELIPLAHPLALTSVAVDIDAGYGPSRPARPRHGQGRRQDRRRDGGADRRLGRLPHRLRHGQGGRPRHGDHRHPPDREARRQIRNLEGQGETRS